MIIRREPMYKRQRKRNTRGWMFGFGFLVATLLFFYTQGDYLYGVALNTLGLAPTPTLMPSDLASQAMDAYLVGDLKGAVALFERAIQERPDNLDFIYEYGLILIEAGEYDKAVETGNRAMELNPFDPRGYTIKSRALLWMGDAAAAIPAALAGQEINRQFAPLYSVLARAYTDIGNIPAGLENGEKAIQMDPLSADAKRSYAYALNFAGAYDEATEQLETALQVSPNNVQVMMELAAQYLSQNRDQEAIDLYSAVTGFQPRNARAYLRLCDAYRKIGQFEQGLSYCEDAVRNDPTFAPAQFRLGMLRYSDREFQAALDAFQACVDLTPDNLDCQYRVGLSHYYIYKDQVTLGALADAAHCDRAWEVLQQSLVIAQNRNNTDAIEDIRLGLGLVSQDCEAYRGVVYPPPLPASTDEPEN